MGKCIERVRAQQAVRWKNVSDRLEYEAFCRYLDNREKFPEPLVVVKNPEQHQSAQEPSPDTLSQRVLEWLRRHTEN